MQQSSLVAVVALVSLVSFAELVSLEGNQVSVQPGSGRNSNRDRTQILRQGEAGLTTGDNQDCEFVDDRTQPAGKGGMEYFSHLMIEDLLRPKLGAIVERRTTV